MTCQSQKLYKVEIKQKKPKSSVTVIVVLVTVLSYFLLSQIKDKKIRISYEF